MPDKNPDVGPTPPGHREPTREEILRHTAPAGLKRWGVIALIVLAVVAIAGVAWRLYQSHDTRSWTADQAIQTVQVFTLTKSVNGGVLHLPGQLQAFTNAPIYAQITGYVQKWFVDIGAPVKAGATHAAASNVASRRSSSGSTAAGAFFPSGDASSGLAAGSAPPTDSTSSSSIHPRRMAR